MAEIQDSANLGDPIFRAHDYDITTTLTAIQKCLQELIDLIQILTTPIFVTRR